MWKFIKSSTNKENWLYGHKKEVCFIGRSNVGKSSLINALTNRKGLAISSNTPGRTLLINYFQNDKKMYVDLPGYGYAKVSKKKINEVSEMVNEYFEEREELKFIVMLIDARHGFMDVDIDMLIYIRDLGIPYVVVATKADKINQSLRHKVTNKIGEYTSNYLFVSSVKKKGIDKLRTIIDFYFEEE